ncbi:MAG: hypothetical protein Q8J78_12045 [Moraxellaceae bacterium]|nr:hypothetical protein [Moraxellaceae bacterium]
MHYTSDDNPAGHYAAFETSTALRRVGEQLVWEVEQGNWRQHDALIAVIEHFDRESAKAYVMDGIHAMGITGSAEHFVQSTLNTLSLTITKLSKQIVPKLDRKQMELAATHVRSLSITLPDGNGGFRTMTGFRVPDSVNARREQIVARIRAGHWQAERKQVSQLLSDLGDLMLEEIYLKSIRLMGFGFLTEKVIQGGAAVGRGLQHQLINWAVGHLQEPEFKTLADYTEHLHLHLPEPLPHTFLYYVRE